MLSLFLHHLLPLATMRIDTYGPADPVSAWLLIHCNYQHYLNAKVNIDKTFVPFPKVFGARHKVSFGVDRRLCRDSNEIVLIITGLSLRVISGILRLLQLLNEYSIGNHPYQPYVVGDRFGPGYSLESYFNGGQDRRVDHLFIWTEPVRFPLFSFVIFYYVTNTSL